MNRLIFRYKRTFTNGTSETYVRSISMDDESFTPESEQKIKEGFLDFQNVPLGIGMSCTYSVTLVSGSVKMTVKYWDVIDIYHLLNLNDTSQEFQRTRYRPR